jgi:hypothetical protein
MFAGRAHHLVLSGTNFHLQKCVRLATVISLMGKILPSDSQPRLHLVDYFDYNSEDGVWNQISSCLDMTGVSLKIKNDICHIFSGRRRFASFFITSLIQVINENDLKSKSKDEILQFALEIIEKALLDSIRKDLQNRGCPSDRLAVLARCDLFRDYTVPSTKHFPELLEGLTPMFATRGVRRITNEEPTVYFAHQLEPMLLKAICQLSSSNNSDLVRKLADPSFFQILPKLRGMYLDYLIMEQFVYFSRHKKTIGQLLNDLGVKNRFDGSWVSELLAAPINISGVWEHSLESNHLTLFCLDLLNQLDKKKVEGVPAIWLAKHGLSLKEQEWKTVAVMPEPVAGLDGGFYIESKTCDAFVTVAACLYKGGVPLRKGQDQLVKSKLENQYLKMTRAGYEDYSSGSDYELRSQCLQIFSERLSYQIHFIFELPQGSHDQHFYLEGKDAYVIIDRSNINKFFSVSDTQFLLRSVDFPADTKISSKKRKKSHQSSSNTSTLCPLCNKEKFHKTCKFRLCPSCCKNQTLATCGLKTHRKYSK